MREKGELGGVLEETAAMGMFCQSMLVCVHECLCWILRMQWLENGTAQERAIPASTCEFVLVSRIS